MTSTVSSLVHSPPWRPKLMRAPEAALSAIAFTTYMVSEKSPGDIGLSAAHQVHNSDRRRRPLACPYHALIFSIVVLRPQPKALGKRACKSDGPLHIA